MRILTVNCGSSSVRLRTFDIDGGAVFAGPGARVMSIGPRAELRVDAGGRSPSSQRAAARDHRAAAECALSGLGQDATGTVEAVGHRIVHGGAITASRPIDGETLAAIRDARKFAPLHNGASLQAIEAVRARLPGVADVAVFDTAFHATMPAVAGRYALPEEIVASFEVRRYGFHGLAHRSLVERYAALRGIAPGEATVITLQLGGGCSAAAVRNGASVDTTMGFTPLEGLMMGTRSGDIDPAVVTYLEREGGMTPDEVERLLNERSGLVGVSGISADMRVVLRDEAGGSAPAHDAVELFCYRVRKQVGAYIAVLGEPQAVIFGGGIGEHAPEVRRRICEPLAPLGVRLDAARNRDPGGEARISAGSSPIGAFVIETDEESIIARETADIVGATAPAIARARDGGG